jgi:hypothetical protein
MMAALDEYVIGDTFFDLIETSGVVIDAGLHDVLLGVLPVGWLAVTYVVHNHQCVGSSTVMAQCSSVLNGLSFLDQSEQLDFGQLLVYKSCRARLQARMETVDYDFHGDRISCAVFRARDIHFVSRGVVWTDVVTQILIRRQTHQNGVRWTEAEVDTMLAEIEVVAALHRSYNDARRPLLGDVSVVHSS